MYRSQGVTDACRYPSTVGEGGPQASIDAFDCAFQVYPSGIDSGPTTLADSLLEERLPQGFVILLCETRSG